MLDHYIHAPWRATIGAFCGHVGPLPKQPSLSPVKVIEVIKVISIFNMLIRVIVMLLLVPVTEVNYELVYWHVCFLSKS